MANPLKLPFEFPPKGKAENAEVKANFEALLQFVQNLNDAVISLTNLLVGTLETTGTAEIGGALTASSTVDVTGALTASSTIEADGDILANDQIKVAVGSAANPAITTQSTSTKGLYFPSSTSVAVSTDSTLAWQSDADQNINQPLQPSFLVDAAADDYFESLVPTSHTVKFGDEIYDQSGSFNTSTYTFTAPATGIYLFILYLNTTGSPTYAFRLTTSNRNYDLQSYSGDDTKDGLFSVLADMDANDTAKLTLLILSNGSNSMEVSGTMSGTLVN